MAYSILDYGEVTIPLRNACNEITFGWTGTFPGDKRKEVPFLHGARQSPYHYSKMLTDWKNAGTKLVLLATETRINHKVYISNYAEIYSGGFGDVEYTIELKWYREVIDKALSSDNAKIKAKTATTQSNATYTIKSGDSLWKIAVSQLGSGSKYTEIYSKNKTILDKKAKEMGHADSKGGSLIFPGTKITIPR